MKTLNNKNYKVWMSKESPEIMHWGITFIEGEYKDVFVEVLNFTSPDFEHEETLGEVLELGDKVNLSIEYGILHKPEDMPIEVLETDHFKTTFDEAITEVIQDTAKKGQHDQNRNVDIIEPDSQRTVY
jgi:hypothetical protein